MTVVEMWGVSPEEATLEVVDDQAGE